MHMRGTRIEKEVEICATNLANKTKCMSTNAKKWGEKKICELNSLNYSAISSQRPLQSCTDWLPQFSSFSRCEPRRQHSVSPVACVTVAAGTCTPSRYPEKRLM
jgi:hypothetical protein